MKSGIVRTIVVPGVVVLSMRVAMEDVGEWLEREMADKWVKKTYWPQEEARPKGKIKSLGKAVVPGEAILAPGPVIEIHPLETKIEPPKDRFNESVKFFEAVGPEPEIYEFEIEVYRRIYGLANSLTLRWREVLWRRLVEHKSITKTASEMNVKPQAVVAFMASIRRKVQKHLYLNES